MNKSQRLDIFLNYIYTKIEQKSDGGQCYNKKMNDFEQLTIDSILIETSVNILRKKEGNKQKTKQSSDPHPQYNEESFSETEP